ncbi:hypothetical protein ACHAXR_001327, partial [Thalassiosira sp. AJA248-18]
EYTHLSPSHDGDVMKRMLHIPVKAGSVVFWDNRTPHGNSYRNDPQPTNSSIADEENGDENPSSDTLGQSASRAVVYCSFLPDVPVNRSFVQRQLEDWKIQRAPRVGDRWIRQDGTNDVVTNDVGADENDGDNFNPGEMQNLSELGERLVGIVEW